MPENFQHIRYVKNDGWALIALSRPEVLNAINTKMSEEISGLIAEIESDSNVRVVVIVGEGRAFSAGKDVKEKESDSLVQTLEEKSRDDFRAQLEVLSKPTIAAINGLALGGGLELALACDIRIVAEGAEMGLTEVTLGMIPGRGGTQKLCRLVGLGHALDMVLTGRRVGSQEALRMGLVSRVVPSEKLIEAVTEVAEDLSRKPPIALSYAKLALRKSQDLPLEEGLRLETLLGLLLRTTEDRAEGIAAFREKRLPHYKGS